ncbi:MAG: hypothetical protein J6Y91_01625 [Alphaproteobacteria bacterium]|nr:hypothetical protein [Alphaproteobacteria bacterium]
MKHQWYPQCQLLTLQTDVGKQLFQAQYKNRRLSLKPVPFLPQIQKHLEVYPEQGLIITAENLYDLEGKLLLNGHFLFAKVAALQKNVLVIVYNDAEQQSLSKVLLWDKQRIIWEKHPSELIYTPKYIALFEEDFWSFYRNDGEQINTFFEPTSNIKFCGDLVVADAVGRHDVYSLISGKMIARNKQFVKASPSDDFALCIDLQRMATIWYRGQYSTLQNVSFAEIIDQAQLFYVQHGNDKEFTVYTYDYCAQPMATGVNVISYNEATHVLLIGNFDNLKRYRVFRKLTEKGPSSALMTLD